MDISARLEALAAAPKPWRYVIRYVGGRVVTIGALSEAAANNGASMYKRKIGRPLISRETGETVVIESVTVEPNQESSE